MAVGGECVKMATPPPHSDPTQHIDGHKCVIRQTKGYRRVPGDTCVAGSQWDAVEIPCPSTLSSYIGKAILFILFLIIISFAVITFTAKYSEFSEGLLYRIKKWFPKLEGYTVVGRGAGPETAEEDFFDHDEVGPSAHLIDSDSQRRSRENFSDMESGSGSGRDKKPKSKKSKNSKQDAGVQFRGLPNAKQASRDVQLPSITPPPGSSAV